MKQILIALILITRLSVKAENPVQQVRGKPNVILILADDMGWTGLSTKMDPRMPDSASDFYFTPNIDKLAEQGMTFSRAYSPASLCTPTRAAILTGKIPTRLHITTPGPAGRTQSYQKLITPHHTTELPESEITIAETLKDAGYTTAHLGKWHIGRSSPGNHGFDLHDGPNGNAVQNDPDTNPKDIFGITERAIKFMETQSQRGTPFYLQLSHYAVHSPIEALEASKKIFDGIPPGERHNGIEYAAMTYDLDRSVGTLLKKVKELGLENNTFVIFMSDNGAAGKPRNPQNLPLSGGKGTLYEGGIRVPLIVRGPGIKQGSCCDVSVTGCDLFPTLCEWAGVKPGPVDGLSINALLTERKEEFKRGSSPLLFHYPHYGQGPNQKPQTAIIEGDFKLIKEHEGNSYKLFDLSKDSSEKTDLSRTMPEKLKAMIILMDRTLEAAKAQSTSPNPDYDPKAEIPQRRNAGRTAR